MSDDEYQQWHEETSSDDKYIERLSEYIASSSKKYSNHLATLRYWLRRDKEAEEKRALQKDPPKNPALNYKQWSSDEYDWDNFKYFDPEKDDV